MSLSLVPTKCSLNLSSWVAIPTEHLFKWQTLKILHPMIAKAKVPKANFSAPSIAALTMSSPTFKPPSVSSKTFCLKLFAFKTLWTSLSPNSQGFPAYLMEDWEAAPVPPSEPEIIILSAYDLTSPAAIAPMPAVETIFTAIKASGLTCFKSKTSWAKSSIELESWWEGGEIKVTPGVVYLSEAIRGVTLWPGNCPPSPGFAPWATFIWISCALLK